MPGVKSGDLGPKLGFIDKDNGWLTFDNVRIPRDHLMQKYISLDRDGSFEIKGDLRIMYATMMVTRQMLVSYCAFTLFFTLVIAVRYSTVRR